MEQPTPVTPLDYADRTHEPLLGTIRFLAFLAIAYAAIRIISFLWIVAMFVGQQFVVPSSGARITFATTEYLLASFSDLIGAILMLIGAAMCIRLRPEGRRLVLIGSMLYSICAAVVVVVSMSSMHRSLTVSRVGWAFVLYYYGQAVFGWLEGCVIPIALWVFFRRSAVREAMRTD